MKSVSKRAYESKEFGAYKVIRKLGDGDRHELFEASVGETMERRLIRRLRPDCRTAAEVERLRAERDALAGRKGGAFLAPIEFSHTAKETFLVLEFFSGQPLSALFQGSAFEPRMFVRLALKMAEALADGHRQGAIHGRLEPASVLVAEDFADIRMLGLVAAETGTGDRDAVSPGFLGGSPEYFSPEHTGRTNRPLDQRSDLYSLGVILYRLLTGRLPFAGSDILEWVHLHIAREPIPPSRIAEEVPEILSDIVLKLLAKSPEERYQGAAGLREDLARCERELSNGRIDPFPLAQHDSPLEFRLPQKIFGRDEPIAELEGAFQRMLSAGKPSLTIVKGVSGIGKTALVNEVRRPLTRERGFFLGGKCDQFKGGIPYAPIAEAFSGLSRQLFAYGDAELQEWREILAKAVGANGRVLAEAIPDIEILLGKQPPVVELAPAEAETRFMMVFERLLEAIASPEHPLVLFLDDMQWADPATLRLVERIFSGEASFHLLLILAFRDDEVPESHPLNAVLSRFNAGPVEMTEIALAPFGRDAIEELIGAVTRSEKEPCRDLAEIVAAKTNGNPFYATEFLKTLHAEGLLVHNREEKRWEWETEEVRERFPSDDVADLLSDRIQSLGTAAQSAIKWAACLGNVFDVERIVPLMQISEEKAEEAAEAAVDAGLLRSDRAERAKKTGGQRYRFLHDRVQKAVYDLFEPANRAEAHLAIARQFSTEAANTQSDEFLFEAASHYEKAGEQSLPPAELLDIARLHVRAAARAKRSTAWSAALKYLRKALRLFPDSHWESHYREMFDASLDHAECLYLTGDFESAKKALEKVLERACDNVDRGRVYALWLRFYQLAGIFTDAMQELKKGIRLFGIEFPDDPKELERVTAREKEEIDRLLAGRKIRELAHLPRMTDPEARSAISLLANAAPCSYLGMPETFPLLALQIVKLSIENGTSEESAFGYSALGMMLIAVWDDIEKGHAFSEMATKLCRQFKDVRYEGKVLHAHGHHVQFWKEPYSTALPIVEEAFDASVASGDTGFANFNSVFTSWVHFEMGSSLSGAIEATRRGEAFARRCGVDTSLHALLGERHLFLHLAGGTADDGYDEEAALQIFTERSFATGHFFHRVGKLIIAFHSEKYAEALAAAKEAVAFQDAARVLPIEITLCLYHALALAAEADTGGVSSGAALEGIAPRLARLRELAGHCEANFAQKAALVAAEEARLRGEATLAMEEYERAGRLAFAAGDYHTAGLAYELGARFYRNKGAAVAASGMIREARQAYDLWGARAKVVFLEQRHPAEFLQSRPQGGYSAGVPEAHHLDAMAVAKASQAISQELVFSDLSGILLRIVIEHAGASRGILFVAEEEGMVPSAEAGVDMDEKGPGGRTAMRFPETVINVTRRTQEGVRVEGATLPEPFARDPYFEESRPASILCLPIMTQGRLNGLIYLENRVSTGVFTPDRVAVLEVLAGQAAISLENSRLFGEATEAIRSRDVALDHLGSFSYSISHDLRAPLRSILNFAAFLVDDHADRLTGESRDFLMRIQRSATRMDRLIHDLLGYSRIHQATPALTTMNLRDVLENVLESDSALVRSGLTVEIRDPLHSVQGQESFLEQCVANILSNAVKYAREGVEPRVVVRTEPRDEKVRIWFEDNGIGIDPMYHERIFHVFERLDVSRGDGTGIGLAIVRKAMEKMRGDAGVESDPGQGSRFWLELPEPPEG